MVGELPGASYADWSTTCDTLHAHSQLLGKLALALAPREPQVQQTALRLTARGWETLPLPAPDGSGALVAALDLRSHEALVEHSDGRARRVALTPNRPVASVTKEVLAAAEELGGAVEVSLAPQEVPWTAPLDEDQQHARYDAARVADYFSAATQAALALAAFRAPYAGLSTPVNAWWGAFDLAVNLFSTATADSPGAQEFAVGWWPGDARYERAAFYAYAKPAPEGFESGADAPAAARWNAELGEYILDWDDVRASASPRAVALDFACSLFAHAGSLGAWDPTLVQSAGPPADA